MPKVTQLVDESLKCTRELFNMHHIVGTLTQTGVGGGEAMGRD